MFLLAALVAICLVVACLLLSSQRRHDNTVRTILITGGASGVGRALTEKHLLAGDVIIVLDQSSAGMQRLQAWAHARELDRSLHCVACDCTDDPSVDRAVASAAKVLHRAGGATLHGGSELHAIIHCAGVFRCGPLIEPLTIHDLRAVLNVNVLGVANVNRAFYDLLHGRVSGAHPRIVLVASEVSASGFSCALNAPYAMSKICLEAYATGLRQELSILRPPCHVCVVRLGPINTPLSTDATRTCFHGHAEASPRWRKPLLATAKASGDYMRRFAIEPAQAAAAIYELCHAVSPPATMALNVTVIMRIAQCMPQPLLDWAVFCVLRRAEQQTSS